jgi:flagellar biosynthesis protein
MARSPSSDEPKKPRAIAVALEEQAGVDAPKVTATGHGAIAEQILAIAFANGVKVREDADLAQMLAAIDVDCPIPTEAFAAVAEILNYVYRANNQMPAGFAAAHHPNSSPQGPTP